MDYQTLQDVGRSIMWLKKMKKPSRYQWAAAGKRPGRENSTPDIEIAWPFALHETILRFYILEE